MKEINYKGYEIYKMRKGYFSTPFTCKSLELLKELIDNGSFEERRDEFHRDFFNAMSKDQGSDIRWPE